MESSVSSQPKEIVREIIVQQPAPEIDMTNFVD